MKSKAGKGSGAAALRTSAVPQNLTGKRSEGSRTLAPERNDRAGFSAATDRQRCRMRSTMSAFKAALPFPQAHPTRFAQRSLRSLQQRVSITNVSAQGVWRSAARASAAVQAAS